MVDGFKHWLVQRVSAVVVGGYVIWLALYCMLHAPLTYDTWHMLFSCLPVQIFTLLTLLGLAAHAWIGMWTIATDYMHCVAIRLPFLVIVNLGLIAIVLWGVRIVWGL
jgi:succinate dehydrogenase / fumarate reductase membrane anchor subunit